MNTVSKSVFQSPELRYRAARPLVSHSVWRSTWRRGIRCQDSTLRGYSRRVGRVQVAAAACSDRVFFVHHLSMTTCTAVRVIGDKRIEAEGQRLVV
jgi:hypothetical protein